MYIHKYMGMPVFVFTYTYICIKQDSWGITVETAFFLPLIDLHLP